MIFPLPRSSPSSAGRYAGVDDDLRLLAGQRPLLRRVRRVLQRRPHDPIGRTMYSAIRYSPCPRPLN